MARGFTLVELLVVISIVALLLAILLPSLSNARQQGKRTVCGANLHQISTAMLAYALEHGDHYPITLNFSQTQPQAFSFPSWGYGGWTGRNSDFWKGFAMGELHAPTQARPLTRYVFALSKQLPDEEIALFRCPSDRASRFEALHGKRMATYDDMGTSFGMNIAWVYQFWPTLDVTPGGLDVWEDYMDRGNELWLRKSQRNAGRFVALGEDPFIGVVRPTLDPTDIAGFHGQTNWHNLAFLDGHVAYVQVIVRGAGGIRQNSGALWSVVD